MREEDKGKGNGNGTHLEVVDQALHGLFHGRARRGDEFVVVDLDGAAGDFIEALTTRVLVM